MSQLPIEVTLQAEPAWISLEGQLTRKLERLVNVDKVMVDSAMDDRSMVKDVLGPLWAGKPNVAKAPKDWVPIGKNRVDRTRIRIILEAIAGSGGAELELPAYATLKYEAKRLAIEDAATPQFDDADLAFWDASAEMIAAGDIDRDLWTPLIGDRDSRAPITVGVYERESIMNALFGYIAIHDTTDGAGNRWYSVLWIPWDASAAGLLLGMAVNERDHERLEERLMKEFERIFGNFMNKFWDILQVRMDQADLPGRIRFRDWWNFVLKENPEEVKAARREMTDLVKRAEAAE